MIALVITTDGRRECLRQTLDSLQRNVSGVDGPRLIFDDSGDDAYRAWLRRLDGFEIIGAGPRRGQDRAVRKAARHAGYLDADFTFWCEDDFTFDRPVDLRELAAVLDADPHLAQMALLRQPWFAREREAGGIVERDRSLYNFCDGWIEHRLWFTLNPSLVPAWVFGHERPKGKRHEWRFSRQLCKDPAVRFGFWGDGAPWITHIGTERRGRGY